LEGKVVISYGDHITILIPKYAHGPPNKPIVPA